jgi:two-component system, NtrC family, sensor kinase
MHLPPVVRLATGIRWQWKVFIPIIAVLLLSIIAIATVLRTLAIHEAQIILIVSVCFAILLCFVLLSVLLVLVERPLEDLMDTIARVRRGDLSARVAFAKRRDDISQLGRQFNEMVEQLECNRIEIEELHRREMGRAEHLATLGELAAGLAHEIRNPLAGIAGVVDVMGKELPASSHRSPFPRVALLSKTSNPLLSNSRCSSLTAIRSKPQNFSTSAATRSATK